MKYNNVPENEEMVHSLMICPYCGHKETLIEVKNEINLEFFKSINILDGKLKIKGDKTGGKNRIKKTKIKRTSSKSKTGGIETKKIRKHNGIIQFGGNKGRLSKGYKYSGRKLKNGLPQIVKTTKKN